MFRRIISLTVSLGLLLQQTVFAYTATLNLSGYLNQGPNLTVSDRFRPVSLRYFSYQPLTNDFNVLLDKGDTKDIADTNLKSSATILLDYFKIGLSLPNDKFWVNLRPDSEDQIIDDELAKTDLGKVMLEADLKLKQDTSLFTSPQTPQGKEYWNKLYQKAGELFGTENITIPTLTRPWIVPGEIILRESSDNNSKASQGAYIYKANLKVMLEEDYLTSSGGSRTAPTSALGNQQYEFNDPRLKELNQYSTQLIRELILPKLTQKVNSSKDYANLRQVYFSLILARWFKETFSPQSIVHSPQNDSYVKLIDSHNLSSLTSKTPWDKTTYFNAYQKSFKEGEYNLSESVYTPTGQVIRRYMSGGTEFNIIIHNNPGNGLFTVKEDIAGSAIEGKDKVTLNSSDLEIDKGIMKDGVYQYLKGSQSILSGFYLSKAMEIINANLSGKIDFSQAIKDLGDLSISGLSTSGKDTTFRATSLRANLAAINLAQKYDFSSIILIKFITYLARLTEPAFNPKVTDGITRPTLGLKDTQEKLAELKLMIKASKNREAEPIIKEGEQLVSASFSEEYTIKVSSAITQEKTTSSAVEKLVYFFGGKESEGVSLVAKKERKMLLGGKGTGMQEMSAMEIPVPPGYTITTTAGVHFLKQGSYPEGLKNEIESNLAKLEALMGKKLGDPNDPLLVSVRSGARDSMPGMMDTVLNLGLTPSSVEGLARKTNNPRFAYDAYRRFIEGFGKIVLGIVNTNEGEEDMFLAIFNQIKQEEGIKAVPETDAEVSAEALKNKVIPRYMELVREKTGQEFPTDPKIQLDLAIKAVFNSWNAQRAKDYREVHNIPADWGTACSIVAMVFGNTGNNSGTGVYFTRDNTTGENKPYGDFLVNAQGDDVVSGKYPTLKINELKNKFPEIYAQLLEIGKKLENVEKEMQDIEFTIQDGKLYILQKRTGKRTGQAAIKIAVDMAKEGLITKEEAISRVSSLDLAQLLYPRLDPKAKVETLAKGEAGSLGVATGKIVFDTESVLAYKKRGEKTILARVETSPEDFKGMINANGILTVRGGDTSHAAIVCKSERKIGVFGAGDLVIDYKAKTIKVGGKTLNEGDIITVDANSKKVYAGEVPLIPGGLTDEAKELLSWADSIRRLDVRANADTWEQAEKAKELGAKGIGLLRIEHWIQVNEELQELFQLWILSDDKEIKKELLSKIGTLLKPDMKKILTIMQGYPVIVRTVDPPLHEFMPKDKDKIKALADKLRISFERIHPLAKRSWFIDKLIKLRLLKDHYVKQIEEKIEFLREFNPMLGHRGVRLGITDPEITEMQTRAIISAGCELVKEGIKAIPEIMIPVVAVDKELKDQEKIVKETAREVMESYGMSQEELPWKFGTMIELPSAARSAKELAGIAEFVSFGTNDLTQTTLGLSRDDSGKFLDLYASKGIMPENPFVTLHPKVYGLMEEAVINARKANKDLEIGICGEHGRDPKSIEIADKIGLDYVSPSGDGILIARLVAAQSELKLRAEREKMGPAPLTIEKLKTALEKISNGFWSLFLESRPTLGRKIETSREASWGTRGDSIVIYYGKDVTAQDIKNYILNRPDIRLLNLFGQKIIKAIAEAEGKASSAIHVSVASSHTSEEATGVLSLTPGIVQKELVRILGGQKEYLQNLEKSLPKFLGKKDSRLLPLIRELIELINEADSQCSAITSLDALEKFINNFSERFSQQRENWIKISSDYYSEEYRKRFILDKTKSDIAASLWQHPTTVEPIDSVLFFFDKELALKSLNEWLNEQKRVSSSLVKKETIEKTPTNVVGGIDFRQMNMLIQPQGSFASSSLDFSLPSLSKAEIESFDLNTELSAIQKMASSGIAPSDERLKEYLAVCFAQERTGPEIDSLKLCLLDVFEQQQLEAKETPNGYKEVLVIADTRGYVLKEGRLAASGQKSYSLN